MTALALCACPAAAAEPLSIDLLGERPFIADPALSPDGKRIAARLNFDDVSTLAIYDLAAGPQGAPKIVPMGSTEARWFGWAGPDRLLIGYTSFRFIVGNYMFGIVPTTRLRGYDLKSGRMTELSQAKEGMLGDDVIFTDPAGRYILLSGQKDLDDTPSVSRVDLETGTAVQVQPKRSDIWSWFADADGNVRGGISYSEKGFTVYYRLTPQGPLQRSQKPFTSAAESAVDTVRILPGSNAGVILTNAPTGRFGVYNYQLGASELGSPIFEHPQVDAAAVQIAGDGSRVEGIYFEDERPRVKWLVPELQQLQAQIDKTLPGKINMILSRSRDGNSVLISSTSGDDPGTYYVFDRAARRMNIFASPHDGLVGASFSPVEPIRYTARDGLSIPGYLTLPKGRPAQGLPLIVMPHGGPFVRDSLGFNPWVQLLASRGYAVLQPNYRGSTGYGRSFVESGYGQWGLKMQDDLDDGVAWLAGRGVVDPKRVCIMGASYGGYASLWGAIRNPEIYRCAISFAGVTDLRKMLKHDAQLMIAKRYWRQWRDRVRGEERRDLAAVSPLQQAARLNVPVLIAHGTRDSTVPAQQGAELVQALRKRNAAVYSVFYANAGHGLETSKDSRDFLKRTEAFLEVHNPADPAPRGPREPELVAGSIGPGDYPAESRRKREEGTVRIAYTVTADGRVTGCGTESSSGFAALDRAACEVAQERFHYRPALAANGARREAKLTHSYSWKLTEAAKPKL